MTKERLLRNHFLFCRKCHLSKQKENTYRIETRRDHMTRDFEHRSSSESSTKLISWKSLKATMSTTCHCAFQIRCQKGRKSRGCCWFGRLISRFLAQPKEALFHPRNSDFLCLLFLWSHAFLMELSARREQVREGSRTPRQCWNVSSSKQSRKGR